MTQTLPQGTYGITQTNTKGKEEWSQHWEGINASRWREEVSLEEVKGGLLGTWEVVPRGVGGGEDNRKRLGGVQDNGGWSVHRDGVDKNMYL